MPPYFETVKSFADVPVDPSIPTAEFLEASDGLVQMFDLLGNAVFGFVQTDIKRNIAGVRWRYKLATDRSETLQGLVVSEANEHSQPSERSGTACLVRLLRGLTFTCKALQNVQRDPHTSNLNPCFKQAYDTVLKHHHSFAIRSVVYVALRTVPRRRDFYDRISQGSSHEKLDVELKKWLDGLEVVVEKMTTFLAEGGYGKV